MDHETAENLVQLAYAAIDAAVQAERSAAQWGRTGLAADRATINADSAAARAAERALVDALRDLARGGEG